eukprot:gene17562-biopygen6400
MPNIAATPQPPWVSFEAVAVPRSQPRGTMACGVGARRKEVGVRPARRHRVRSRGGKTVGALARLRGAAGPRADALPCVARLWDRAHACWRSGAHCAPQARCHVLREATRPCADALALMAHAPRPRVPDQLALACVGRGHRAARWRADIVLLAICDPRFLILAPLPL